MHLQKLYGHTRKAIQKYNLISPNDRIAVGLSGGKDSLTLLYALAGLRQFYPVPFELEAITVDLGFGMCFDSVSALCESLQVPYTIITTEISEIVSARSTNNYSCSLCAKLRKGALNQQALALNCNKIAYAHHRDDIVDTLIMSMYYEHRLYSFAPYTYLDHTGLALIRPLIYVSEREILNFKEKYHLPVIPNLCPADGATKRTQVRTLIDSLGKTYPGLREYLFTAIENSDIADWVNAKNRGEMEDSL